MRSPAVFACALLVALTGWVATAEATTPGIPTHVHVAAATATSFTVALDPSPNATSYQVFYSLTRTDLIAVNVTSHTKSVTATGPGITVSGLAYTASPYWYRVEAHNGTTGSKWGADILTVGLTPPAPTGVGTLLHSTVAYGGYVYWSAEHSSNGFVVTQSTDPAMTANVVTRSITGPEYQYTPPGLAPGNTYYFRVRARNVSTLSAPSAQVSLTAQARQTPVKVLTYNILDAKFSGQPEGGTTIASWALRRTVVAKNILQASPDVAGIQEAGSFIGSPAGFGGTRQVDDLLKLLPGYGLARTEVPPTEHSYLRFGNYVIYKKATIRPVGTGGHWTIGDTRTAAYQELDVIATGAKFLFVTAHTIPDPGGTADAKRETETLTLLKYAGHQGALDHVRVIYGADFNSDGVAAYHAFDGPGIAMQSYRNSDSRRVALSLTNSQYNSSNQYLRTPPAAGQAIDYIYVAPGVPVESWGMVVNVSGGKFVGTIGSDHNPVWAVVTIPS